MATHSGGHARLAADDEEGNNEHHEILASLPPISARELDMELGMLLTG
jgi:hypothetical protein